MFPHAQILGQLPDLQVCASTTFNNLRHLRFKAEHTCSETNLDINTMTNLLKSPDCERNLLLDLPEVITYLLINFDFLPTYFTCRLQVYLLKPE